MNLQVYIQTLRVYKYILKFGEFVVYNKSYQTLGKDLSEYKAFKHLNFCATHKSQMSELELQLM